MFILIRRVGKRRRRPIPTGAAGRAALRAEIENAVGLFSGCTTQEEYEKLPEALKLQPGGHTLAEERCLFLPEICAENESGTLDFDEHTAPGVCRLQLADYSTMRDSLFELFAEEASGGKTSEIYWDYITFSSIYGAVRQMTDENGGNAPLEGRRAAHFVSPAASNRGMSPRLERGA